MESDYALVPLGQIAKLRSGYSFKSSDWTETGCPVIKIANVKAGRIVPEGCAFVSEATALGAREWWTRDGDVLIAMTGYVGEVARVRKGERFLINQRVGRFELHSDLRAVSSYLFYAIQHPEIRGDLENISRGSAQANLSAKDAERILVPLPKLSEQRQITEVLSLLDDRIDLLRQTNATLEAIAQALFKSWFIDFDPVRAKAEGREPDGMEAATAAVFPAEFEESALGLIPKGWRADSVYEICSVTYGAPFASNLFNGKGEGQPLVRIRDLRDEAPGVWTPEVHPKGYMLTPGDIVVGMDGEFRAYLWGGEPAWMNQRVCCFKPKAPFGAAFVRSSIAGPLAHIEATEVATTVIHLGKGDIDRFKVAVPANAVASAFSRLTDPLYQSIVSNKTQARLLAGIRDNLLPRLITGKLSLPEAQAQVEEAIA